MSLRWAVLAVVLGSVACAAAPIDDGLDRRGNFGTEEDEQKPTKKQESSADASAPAPSGSSSSSPAPSPPSSSSAPAPSPTAPPAPQPSSPTGACTTTDAPAACTALEAGALCTGLARCQSSGSGSAGTWGACQCGLVTVDIAATKDCVTVTCPATAPNVVGCSITFTGDDGRGCVASSSTNPSSVFLKEGNKCGAGNVGGTLFCSPTPSTGPLNATTCPMNSAQKLYVASASSCPS